MTASGKLPAKYGDKKYGVGGGVKEGEGGKVGYGGVGGRGCRCSGGVYSVHCSGDLIHFSLIRTRITSYFNLL